MFGVENVRSAIEVVSLLIELLAVAIIVAAIVYAWRELLAVVGAKPSPTEGELELPDGAHWRECDPGYEMRDTRCRIVNSRISNLASPLVYCGF